MRLALIALVLLCPPIGFLGGFFVDKISRELPRYEEVTEVASVVVTLSEKEESTPISLLFVGDVMLDRGVRRTVEKFGLGDYSFVFQNANLPNHDLLFGNLEGPVSSLGTDVGSIYSFRMDPAVIPALRSFGFSVLSLANNHITDWGRVAADDTRARLEVVDIKTTGWSKDDTGDALAVFDIRGMKLGFLAFSQFGPESISANATRPGILLLSAPYYETLITEAKKEVDFLVVSLHLGEEYQKEPSKYDEQIARTAIDVGADIVVGHHPHVVRPIERYKGGLIAYSLGNFVFDQNFSKETREGGLLLVKIDPGIYNRSFTTGTSTQNSFFQIETIDMSGIWKSFGEGLFNRS